MNQITELQSKPFHELAALHKSLKSKLRKWEKDFKAEHDGQTPVLTDKKEAGVFSEYTKYALVRKLMERAATQQVSGSAPDGTGKKKDEESTDKGESKGKGKEKENRVLPSDFFDPIPGVNTSVSKQAWGEGRDEGAGGCAPSSNDGQGSSPGPAPVAASSSTPAKQTPSRTGSIDGIDTMEETENEMGTPRSRSESNTNVGDENAISQAGPSDAPGDLVSSTSVDMKENEDNTTPPPVSVPVGTANDDRPSTAPTSLATPPRPAASPRGVTAVPASSVLDISTDVQAHENTTEAVQVIARFRPQNEIEDKEKGVPNVSYPSDNVVEVTIRDMPRVGSCADYAFKFSKVFPDYAEQEDIYNEVGRQMVDNLFHGYHSSILAYGQTGSGKTHTMFGADLHNDREAGLIPRLLHDIFARIELDDDENYFSVHASFVEIYNETLSDLFTPKKKALHVRETSNNNLWIPSAMQVPVESGPELLKLIKAGGRRRVVASTKANDQSSRSHAIVILTLKQTPVLGGATKMAQMYLADLAGSERVQKTNVEGQELHEAKYINRSLLSLGQVIERLSKKGSATCGHVPYRDSLLTRVLMNSFGGNARTALIVTCSSSSYNDRETLSTLRFGTRASKIINLPKMNNDMGVDELKRLLNKAKEEIRSLRRTIYDLNHSAGGDAGMRMSARGTRTGASDCCNMCAGWKASARKAIREADELRVTNEILLKQNKSYRQQILAWVDEDGPQKEKDLYRCPITREVMTDPVVALDGFTYDRYAITEWFKHGYERKSPMTGEVLSSTMLIPNKFVRSYIRNDAELVAEADEVEKRVRKAGKTNPKRVTDTIIHGGLVLLQSRTK